MRSSLLRYASSLVLLAAPLSGCDLVLGIGGEVLAEGGGGTGGGGAGGAGGGGGVTTGGPCEPGKEAACYSGPDGTEMVGACKGGLATCSEEGMWGACAGEVTPSLETCSSTEDEDCDGKDCTYWVKTILGTVYGSALDIDPQGNIVVAVSFTEAVDLGDGMPTPPPEGFVDIALLKFDRTGAFVWKKVFTAPGSQQVDALAVDAQGNIAIGGSTTGALDLGKGPLPAGAFVAKFDASGAALWSISAQSPAGPASVSHVAIDSKGRVVAGGSAGTIDFGAGALVSGDAQSFFVVKLSADTGGVVWAKITKGGANETLEGLVVDGSDSPVLTGSWNGSYLGLAAAGESAPNDVYNPNGEAAIFLLRLDSDGNMSNGKLLAGLNSGFSGNVNGLGVDSLGWSVLVGDFSGSIQFNEGSYDAGPGSGVFVVRDQTTSFEQWTHGYAKSDVSANFNEVAIDGSDGISIVGRYEGPADFGGGQLPPAPAALVLKFDKDGTFQWNKSYPFGDGGIERVAAGSLEDETVIMGTFYGSANFGDGIVTAPQGFFLVRLAK